MKRPAALFLVLFLLPSAALSGAEPNLLIRAERQQRDDLTVLRRAGLPVIHETSNSLFLEGTGADVESLRQRGFAVEVLDRGADRSDYLQVGSLAGTDAESPVFSLGSFLYAEENWSLIAVPRGSELEPLHRARLLVTRLRHEPVTAPSSTAQPLAVGTRSMPDPLIQRIVDAVDPLEIDRYWTDLSDNPPTATRFTASQGCEDASIYGHDELELAGVPAELQEHSPWGMDHAPNVIGTHPGAVTPDRVYIVTGHLDDVPNTGPAPGANDNASGAVAVLESARVMSCYAFRSTVKFILPTGEEVGRLGSDAYAADALARGEDIRGVLNFDMIAWEGDGSPDPENLDLNYNDPSEDLALTFVQAAADYNTGLSVDAFLCPSLSVSDHYPFWVRGFKAVCGVTDNHGYCRHKGTYPYYHTAQDTIANTGDPTLFHRTIKTAVATLATLAEPFKVTFENGPVTLGSAVRLTLGDRDLNTTPGAVETVEVEVWSATEPTPEIFVLAEQAADSMIFSGDVPTTTEAPVHGDGAISVADGDQVSVRYVDALDCDGSVGVTYIADVAADGAGLVPIEVSGLTVGPGAPAWVDWNGLTNAAAYDVAGGLIDELRQDGGFARAACLAGGVTAPAWQDPRPGPPAGAGFYYLLRGRNGNGAGPYGHARSLSACP